MMGAARTNWFALCLLILGVEMISYGYGNSIDVRTGKEGRDFYYDEAVGRKMTCAGLCDEPTGYATTCKVKCKGYIPKVRATTPPDIDNQSDDNTILFVVVGVLVGLAFGAVLVLIFKKTIKIFMDNLHEILCRRLTTAETETGNGPSQAVYSPVSNQDQPHAQHV